MSEEQIEETVPDGAQEHKSANVAKQGWKEWLKFGKPKPMPPKDWKKNIGKNGR